MSHDRPGEMELDDDHREATAMQDMRISCDETGSLRFKTADGSFAVDAERNSAIAQNRGELIDLLARSAAASQVLLRLGDRPPDAVFRRHAPVMPRVEAPPTPAEPVETDLPLPRRNFLQWLVPPLWGPIREKSKRDAYQARQVYLLEHEAWRKEVECLQAKFAAEGARLRTNYKADESRYLQRQVRVVKATDRSAVLASFAAQMRDAAWATLLTVETDIAADCRAASVTVSIPSIDTFESVCPPPCEVDSENLRLSYGELTPRELKRRYDLFVMASTLKVAAAAFASIPTLNRASVIAEHREADAPMRFVLAHVALSRKVWAAGWKTPDAPMLELNRLRGKFSLAPRRMAAHAV